MPKPVSSIATRGKSKRVHKLALEAKRRREAAAAATLDDIYIDEGSPAPAGSVPFPPWEVEESDNPMEVG